MPNEKTAKTTPQDCVAYCPICGSDLAHFDNCCICKNKNCTWKCTKCQQIEDELEEETK